jgi:hypothetical protein
MSYARLLIFVALGILLASPAFPQSPDDSSTLRFTPRPVTITTAGGRTYVVGIQRSVLEPVEAPPAPSTVKPAEKLPAKTKLSP